jgi:hypothetical protein
VTENQIAPRARSTTANVRLACLTCAAVYSRLPNAPVSSAEKDGARAGWIAPDALRFGLRPRVAFPHSLCSFGAGDAYVGQSSQIEIRLHHLPVVSALERSKICQARV